MLREFILLSFIIIIVFTITDIFQNRTKT